MRRFDTRKFVLSLILDGIGMLSYAVPGIGEIMDMIWAPVAAWLLVKMYPGATGKVAGTVEFLEEIIPGATDYIPTFTLTFLYDYFTGEHSRTEGEEPESLEEVK